MTNYSKVKRLLDNLIWQCLSLESVPQNMYTYVCVCKAWLEREGDRERET